MNEKLQSLEQFFDYDLQIKKLISFYPDINDNQGIVYYLDTYDKILKEIKYMLMKMLQFTNANTMDIKHVNKLFKQYEKMLLKSITNQYKLIEFYQTCIANMNPELIDEINREIKGYYVYCNPSGLILKSQTINELLHVLHSYVVNNESFYEMMPILEEKANELGNKIILRGNKVKIAEQIFNNMPFSLNSAIIDILALKSNKILIMARDFGHALTIEVEIENQKAHVSYFIPKICNIHMVNRLNGITPVKIDEKGKPLTPYAKGSFEVDKTELTVNLLELMANVPQDRDVDIQEETINNRNR